MKYRKLVGARIRSEANDLKRTPSSLASEMGVSLDFVQKIFNGDLPTEDIFLFAKKMVEIYPLNLTDILIPYDASDDGISFFPLSSSIESSRVFNRKNKLNIDSPYYEYRDTAMSRLSPFRPEWITPLVVANDDNPNNPLIVYNRGHLLHQTTFFIGKVNFYWQVDGVSYCKKMNTGDSNIITPFFPHSFSSRNPLDLGLIIACTFAGRFRNSLNEISLISPKDLDSISGNLSTFSNLFKSKLNRFLKTEAMTNEVFIDEMIFHGLAKTRIESILFSDAMPETSEINLIADVLNIPSERLTGVPFLDDDAVLNEKFNSERFRPWPSSDDCRIKFFPLARSKHHPDIKSFSLEVMYSESSLDSLTMFSHMYFEYIYNYGNINIELVWGSGRVKTIAPGDSAIINPMVKHCFKIQEDSPCVGNLYMVRAPGNICDDSFDEYAKFCHSNRERSLFEKKMWF